MNDVTLSKGGWVTTFWNNKVTKWKKIFRSFCYVIYEWPSKTRYCFDNPILSGAVLYDVTQQGGACMTAVILKVILPTQKTDKALTSCNLTKLTKLCYLTKLTTWIKTQLRMEDCLKLITISVTIQIREPNDNCETFIGLPLVLQW